jgi:hypothetical protein
MDKDKAIKKVKQKKEPSKYKQYLEEASDDRQYYMELMKKSDAFKAINPRQRLFCINYVLTGGNASQASVLSGCTSKYYAQQGAKWMAQDVIQQAIREFWEIVFGDKIDKIERNLIDALYRRAFSNRWQYFNKDGTLKDKIHSLEDLGEDHVLIDGIETKFYGKDADISVTVYKLADRDSAFKQLQSILGLDTKNINLANTTATTGVLQVPGVVEADKWDES